MMPATTSWKQLCAPAVCYRFALLFDALQVCLKKCNIGATVKCYESACRIQVRVEKCGGFIFKIILRRRSKTGVSSRLLSCTRPLPQVKSPFCAVLNVPPCSYKEVAEIAEADGSVEEALKNFKAAAEYYAQVLRTSIVARVPRRMLSALFRRSRPLRRIKCSSK
jgi:hypothetical protein